MKPITDSDNEKKMFDSIFDFLNHNIEFEEFLKLYYDFYFDIDESDFRYSDFHSLVCEKLDFTSENEFIDKIDKQYGWITKDEFKIWLKMQLDNKLVRDKTGE